MARSKPKMPDWKAINRAGLERDRELYRSTTPGERIERVLDAARVLTRSTGTARKA